MLFTLAEKNLVEKIKELPKELYFLEWNGSVYQSCEEIGEGKLIQLHFRSCGGKGGFGSLLRSFRIHKSNNQLMCRNLTGRRLADVREEERLKKWISKKVEREKAKVQKKKDKIAKLENGGPKHEFADQKYLLKRDTLQDEVEDAIEAGMKALQEVNENSKIIKDKNNDNNISELPSTSKANGTEILEENSSDSDIDMDDLLSSKTFAKRESKLNK